MPVFWQDMSRLKTIIHVSEVEVFAMTARSYVYRCEWTRPDGQLKKKTHSAFTASCNDMLGYAYANVLHWTVSATVCAVCQRFESLRYIFCAHGVKICITSVTALRPRFQISQIWRLKNWNNLPWHFCSTWLFWTCNAAMRSAKKSRMRQIGHSPRSARPQNLSGVSVYRFISKSFWIFAILAAAIRQCYSLDSSTSWKSHLKFGRHTLPWNINEVWSLHVFLIPQSFPSSF